MFKWLRKFFDASKPDPTEPTEGIYQVQPEKARWFIMVNGHGVYKASMNCRTIKPEFALNGKRFGNIQQAEAAIAEYDRQAALSKFVTVKKIY